MKLFRTLIPLREAQNMVLRHVKRVGVEEVSFDLAAGRVLAEDIISEMDSPPFNRAAMDGYAVKAEDTFGAAPDKPLVLHRREPGSESEELNEGEYIPVQTGMPMPKGSNAVLMLEYGRERDSKLEIFKPVTPGKNVSFKGEDVRRGDIILNKGRVLRAADIGMLASIGKSRVKVYKRGIIGILSTGDELYDPKGSSKGAIADVNSYVLAALMGMIAKPSRMGIVRDNYDALKAAIESCITDCDADAILVSGGSSVGNRDFIGDVVEDLGEMIFHGVAIRPGEPTGFGIINEKPIFCLPGYPVSMIAAFEMLVRPLIEAMHGLKGAMIRQVFAVVSKKIPSAVGRTDFVRVRLYHDEYDGKYYVEPIRVSGSGILSSVTRSDGFVIIEDNKEGIEEGEQIGVNLW